MARLCLALLRNMSGSFKVVDKSVRNFDMVSYYRGNPKGFPLFFGSGGRTDVLSSIYNPPKPSFDKEGLDYSIRYTLLNRSEFGTSMIR